MKKKMALMLIAVAVLGAASAFALAGSASFIPDDCGNTPCTCFVQLNDAGRFVEAVEDLLKAQGYLGQSVRVGQFTRDVEAAVIRFQEDHGLAPTGTLDDDALTLLIWGLSPEALDRAMPVDSGDPSTFPDRVYIPTDGGKKRHSNPTCSQMYDPRKVSIRNAEKLGYGPCARCEAKREASLH